jgi:hypothetical protein
MPDQDAFIQFLLLDKFLHILCHGTIIVLGGMKRMTMIT